jgi:hypothetical protein
MIQNGHSLGPNQVLVLHTTFDALDKAAWMAQVRKPHSLTTFGASSSAASRPLR